MEPLHATSRRIEQLPRSAGAMVFTSTGVPLEPREVPIPHPLPEGSVLVQMRLATICGSDLHTWQGRRVEPAPSILGHEGVGTVIALGAGRRDVAVGDRVTWSLCDSCGVCAACTLWALPQKCENLFKYGHARLDPASGPDGCYATHIVLRKGTHVVKLPDMVTDRMAVTANCALATMVHAIDLLPTRLERVWIQGAGLLGLFGAALLRQRGSVPYVSDPDARRLALVGKVGAIPLPMEDTCKLSNLDAVIEVAGVADLVPQGVRALRPQGLYLLVGQVHPDTHLTVTGEQIVRRCLSIQGAYNYSPWHLDTAIAFLEKICRTFPFDEVISPAIPLRDINDALELAKGRQWARVSIDCSLF